MRLPNLPPKRISIKNALTVGLTSFTLLTTTPSMARPAIAAEPVAASITATARATTATTNFLVKPTRKAANRRRKQDDDTATQIVATPAVRAPPSSDVTAPLVVDPRPGGRIVDAADMIQASWGKAIAHNIGVIEKEDKGAQVLVVTVKDVPAGYHTPKQFATALFNRWGVGSAKTNKGVLVLVVKHARRVEIEVGVGVEESFTTNWCTSMLKKEVVPLFKDGEYGKGINAAVLEVGGRLQGGGKRFEATKSGTFDTIKETVTYGFALLASGVLGGGGGSGGGDDYDGGGFSSGDSGGGADW